MNLMNLMFQLFERLGKPKKRAIQLEVPGILESEPIAQSVVENPHLQAVSADAPKNNVDDTIPVLPASSVPTLMRFIEENKPMVYRYFYMKIRDAVKYELDEAVLFRLGDTDKLLFIEKVNFEKSLDEMIKFSLQTEDYEMVSRLRKLNDKLIVNKVIDETR